VRTKQAAPWIGRALVSYYLATPLFAVADFVMGAPVRLSGVEDPAMRAAYYVGLMLLGVAARARPAWAPLSGMVESSVNLFLLLVGILLPIWSLPDAWAAGQDPAVGLDATGMINAMISGSVLVFSFRVNQGRLMRNLTRHG